MTQNRTETGRLPVVTVGGACAAIRIIDGEIKVKKARLSVLWGLERPYHIGRQKDANGEWHYPLMPGRTPEETGSPLIRAEIAELEAERDLWRVYLRACADNLPTTKQGGAA